MNWAEELEKLIISNEAHLGIQNMNTTVKKRAVELPYSMIYSGNNGFRDFVIKYDAKNQLFSVFLIQHPLVKVNQFLGYCYFCGTYKNIKKVFHIVRDWKEFSLNEEEIFYKYPCLIRFIEDKWLHPNEQIEEAWMKVRNQTLNNHSLDINYVLFRHRYELLISKAKRKKILLGLYPYTSLGALCFRKTPNFSKHDSVVGRIFPMFDSIDNKAYCVQTSEYTEYFAEIDDALDYLCKDL